MNTVMVRVKLFPGEKSRKENGRIEICRSQEKEIKREKKERKCSLVLASFSPLPSSCSKYYLGQILTNGPSDGNISNHWRCGSYRVLAWLVGELQANMLKS